MTSQHVVDASKSSEVFDKPHADHHEDAANIADHEMSPWQCIKQNPKIVMWTLFTNGKSP